MGDRTRRRAWPVLLAPPAAALASFAAVAGATHSAGLTTDGAHRAERVRVSAGATHSAGLTTDGAHRAERVRVSAGAVVGSGLDVPAMLPGESAVRCVEVTSAADRAGRLELRVYGVSAGALARHMGLSIDRGANGATCASPGDMIVVYDGRLADLGTDFRTGHPGHRPVAAGRPVPYRFVVSLDEDTPDSAQGARATVEIVWEVRDTSPTR